MKPRHDKSRYDELQSEPTEPEDWNPENPRRRFRRWGCAALSILFLLAALTVYLLCVYAPPLRISGETTRITGPLAPDGRIDFFKALEEKVYPPELATDENGYRHFVRVFGDIQNNNYGSDPSYTEFYRKQKYRKLGLDPDVKPTLFLPEDPHHIAGRYYADRNESLPRSFPEMLRGPWTLDDLPMLAEWLKEIEEPLDAISEMVRKPLFFPPYLEEHESFVSKEPQAISLSICSDIQLFRQLARLYQPRACYRIGTGNIDGAVDDIISLFALGRKTRQSSLMWPVRVGIAIELVGTQVPVAANPQHPPTREQLRRLLDSLRNLPDPVPVERTLEFERLVALDIMQRYYETKVFDNNMGEVHALKEFPFDKRLGVSRSDPNVAYRRLNRFYDVLVETRGRKDDFRFHNEMRLISMNDNSLRYLMSSGRGEAVAEVVINLLMDEIREAVVHIRMGNCSRNMKFLTLALLLYKAEHGEFPRDDWVEKIKPYLGDKANEYFRCPGGNAGKGESDYAMVLYNEPVSDGKLPLLVELDRAESYRNAIIVDPRTWLIETYEKYSADGSGLRHGDVSVVGLHNGAVAIIREPDFMSKCYLPLRRHLIENGYLQPPPDEEEP